MPNDAGKLRDLKNQNDQHPNPSCSESEKKFHRHLLQGIEDTITQQNGQDAVPKSNTRLDKDACNYIVKQFMEIHNRRRQENSDRIHAQIQHLTTDVTPSNNGLRELDMTVDDVLNSLPKSHSVFNEQELDTAQRAGINLEQARKNAREVEGRIMFCLDNSKAHLYPITNRVRNEIINTEEGNSRRNIHETRDEIAERITRDLSQKDQTLFDREQKALLKEDVLVSMLKDGLGDKMRNGDLVVVSEEIDTSFSCHHYTFFNGKNKPVDRKFIEEDFQLLHKKNDFKNNEQLYYDLHKKLTEDNGKNKDKYIAAYRVNGDPLHSSPIHEVYRKKNGELGIRFRGKWGPNGFIVIHDSEDVMSNYKDQDGQTNWEIRVTDREKGRIMD